MSVEGGAPASAGELFEVLNDEWLPLPARLDAARQAIALLEEAAAEVKRQALALVAETKLDDDTIVTLYWDFEGLVPAKMLGNFHQLSDMLAERCPWTWPCGSCGAEQPVRSRSHLKELQKPPSRYARIPMECDSCKAQRARMNSAQYAESQAAHAARLRELKTMPYQEYLDSPEWKERRAARLKAASYACQVCNKRNVTLNVHHRTYIRRGEEYARDLVVLCQECHHLFHRNGSLADRGRGA